MNPGEEREHGLMMSIFSVSAAMIGVCLTGIGIMRVVTTIDQISTLSDEFLACDAILFLVSCLSAFLSFRARDHTRRKLLRKVADISFFLGLLVMSIVCILITTAIL